MRVSSMRRANKDLALRAVDSTLWMKQQVRAFCGWANYRLEAGSRGGRLHDVATDLRDGTVLAELTEELTGVRLGRGIKHNPTMKIQCIGNLARCLQVLREHTGMPLVNISAEDLYEGKPNIVLGLLWSLVCHYQVEALASISDASYSSTSSSSSHFLVSSTTKDGNDDDENGDEFGYD